LRAPPPPDPPGVGGKKKKIKPTVCLFYLHLRHPATYTINKNFFYFKKKKLPNKNTKSSKLGEADK
ncbi:hypothetical protein ACVGW2_08625, partial [Enterobacter intestinihominis]